jgi:hypothetical protein
MMNVSFLSSLGRLDMETIGVLTRFVRAALKSPDPQAFVRAALSDYLDKPAVVPTPIQVKVTSTSQIAKPKP